MTNANDLLEHTEKCDACINTWHELQEGVITQEQYDYITYQCFENCQASKADRLEERHDTWKGDE